MTRNQKSVVIGSILGDGYLQKTGKENARLRLEHSLKQKDYLLWKCEVLKNFFQSKPQYLERNNLKFGKTYQYIRAQSYSGAEFGKLQRLFYKDNLKVIPDKITTLLKDPRALAVWFMDDGYFYARDKMAYFYLPPYDPNSLKNLMETLKSNFNLEPVLKKKRRGELVLVFSVPETVKLLILVKNFIIPAMEYKLKILFDPVSTETHKRNNR